MPITIPTPTGIRNGRFFISFLIFGVIASISLSKIFVTTAIVPPLTPGIALPMPTAAPLSTSKMLSFAFVKKFII